MNKSFYHSHRLCVYLWSRGLQMILYVSGDSVTCILHSLCARTFPCCIYSVLVVVGLSGLACVAFTYGKVWYTIFHCLVVQLKLSSAWSHFGFFASSVIISNTCENLFVYGQNRQIVDFVT